MIGFGLHGEIDQCGYTGPWIDDDPADFEAVQRDVLAAVGPQIVIEAKPEPPAFVDWRHVPGKRAKRWRKWWSK